MKKILLSALTLLMALGVYAADPSEDGVPTTPLKIYSGGITLGGIRAVNDELKEDVTKNLLKVSFANVFSIRPNVDLFMDASVYFPEACYGADFGADFIFSPSEFRPFAGFGIGGFFVNRGGEFSDDFGPSITAHFGFTLDVTETVAVRLRAPYHFILNDFNDQAAGLDLTILFSSRLKNVKKLQYN